MIEVQKLNKTYDRRSRNANHVLKDVSFTLPKTGFVCILGPSGCGKTSLLNAVGGLDRFDNGTLSTENVRVSRYGKRSYENERNRNFGYIFQNYYLLPEHSVAYNIYLGLHSMKLPHREKLQRIRQALDAVDMSRYIRRKVGELSGGQQQRVAIARALARRPGVIFADEPTGNLDEANTMNICTLLRKISRQSLVVMVTHEERIAQFFADRIIRMDQGRIFEDTQSWQRDGLALGNEKELYAGDYQEETPASEGARLRILQEEGAAPVDMTVVVLKDRIVLKLSDGRAVTCGADQELPLLKEGKRPTVTLESMDEGTEDAPLIAGQPAPHGRAGHGIGPGMMLREAKQLKKGGGAKRIGMRLFLVVLTVLTMWTVCDYLTVSSIDPRTFITNESHILEIRLKRGPEAGATLIDMDEQYLAFGEYLLSTGLDVDFLPPPTCALEFSSALFPQLENVEETIMDFNYVLLPRLNPETLVYGRLPEGPREVVVDRWLLDKLLAEDSILSNCVGDVQFFLNTELRLDRGTGKMTIVGISDNLEPAVYVSPSALLSTAVAGGYMMSLSELKAAMPEYGDLTLSDTECLINISAAGRPYEQLVGKEYDGGNGFVWTIADTVELADSAMVIVSDSQMQLKLRSLCTHRHYLYCADKEAVKQQLAKELPELLEGVILVEVIDDYAEDYAAYAEASKMKVNARTVVTVTVILLSMVMLYLLCRSQAQERLGMMAVYRLLGIPKRKLTGIFALEAILSSLQTALPAAAATYLVVTVLTKIEDLDLTLVLPWQAALGVYGAILAYHLLAALLPLHRLLRLPPAVLAAKYDF